MLNLTHAVLYRQVSVCGRCDWPGDGRVQWGGGGGGKQTHISVATLSVCTACKEGRGRVGLGWWWRGAEKEETGKGDVCPRISGPIPQNGTGLHGAHIFFIGRQKIKRHPNTPRASRFPRRVERLVEAPRTRPVLPRRRRVRWRKTCSHFLPSVARPPPPPASYWLPRGGRRHCPFFRPLTCPHKIIICYSANSIRCRPVAVCGRSQCERQTAAKVSETLPPGGPPRFHPHATLYSPSPGRAPKLIRRVPHPPPSQPNPHRGERPRSLARERQPAHLSHPPAPPSPHLRALAPPAKQRTECAHCQALQKRSTKKSASQTRVNRHFAPPRSPQKPYRPVGRMRGV